MKRHSLRMAAAALALSLLTGCAALLHPREVEQLQLVQTIGFDGTAGDIAVSVSSGAALESVPSARLAARGESIHTAVQHLQDFSAREELFFAHIRYVAAGEDAARHVLPSILDYFERGTQTQLSVPLFVVRGGTAYELVMHTGTDDSEITSVLSSLEEDNERQGLAHCFTILEIAARLARSGAALACAVTCAAPEASIAPAEEDAQLALAAGYAVLRGSALCGFLDPDAALGADLLLGLAPEASYALPDGHGGTITVQLHSSRASFEPLRGADGALTLRATVSCRAGIVESSGGDTADSETIALLERELSRVIETQITAALEASQTLEADFLELWRFLPPEARGGERLSALRFAVRVESVMERSYDIFGRAVHGKEE